jgi:hypothetical protein
VLIIGTKLVTGLLLVQVKIGYTAAVDDKKVESDLVIGIAN